MKPSKNTEKLGAKISSSGAREEAEEVRAVAEAVKQRCKNN